MNIYKAKETYLRAGFTKEAVCSMLAQAKAESGLIANNVQDSSGIPDELYDYDAYDQIGFGLFQWTTPDRKLKLEQYCDATYQEVYSEDAQIGFSIYELQSDFPDLFKLMCISHDLLLLTQKLLYEYENPAIKNLGERYEYAKEFMEIFDSVPAVESTPLNISYYKRLSAIDRNELKQFPILAKGAEGIWVHCLQALLCVGVNTIVKTTGKFDNATENVIKHYQRQRCIEVTGIADLETWSSFFA